jgi:DNA-binding MarR family transcriptional regulator
VTQLVDRLEADGLVTRTLGAADRRSRLAILTAAGHLAYAQGARLELEAEREIFAALTEEDLAALAQICDKLQRLRDPHPVEP